MITIEKIEVYGWEAAIRGLRNPMNSWEKSDSGQGCTEQFVWGKPQNLKILCSNCDATYDSKCVCNGVKRFVIGENDLKLMQTLSKAGNDHGKYLRMINVTCDILAPLYWWKEYDSYKVGTVANSCSTMHKIHDKEFSLDDFSHEHLNDYTIEVLKWVVKALNSNRKEYLLTRDKEFWWQMIQLLPSSYNQLRTVQLNYQVLKSMYHSRKNHKLDEWREFCTWVESLPYFKEICIEMG